LYKHKKLQGFQNNIYRICLINCKKFYVNYVIEQLKKIDVVKYIQGVFGTFDIIIKVDVDVKNIFNKIISTQIQKIKKINYQKEFFMFNMFSTKKQLSISGSVVM